LNEYEIELSPSLITVCQCECVTELSVSH